MSVKDGVLFYLENSRGAAVSGGAIAENLGVSRNAVFKAVNILRAEGYGISSSRGGYTLGANDNRLSIDGIKKFLAEKRYNIHLYNEVDSTNTVAKRAAEDGAPGWSVFIAESQIKGRGRLGKSFVSSRGTGIYTSVLLYPDMPADKAVMITVTAAVAAAEAIEANCGKKTMIQWVNDVYIDDRKVCGILTEASFDTISGRMAYAVLGVGINVAPPSGGFAPEIKAVAGAMAKAATADLRAKTIASFLDLFAKYYDAGAESITEKYRARQYLTGKAVEISQGDKKTSAVALGTDDSCRLRVRYADGREDVISFGEVSVKSKP